MRVHKVKTIGHYLFMKKSVLNWILMLPAACEFEPVAALCIATLLVMTLSWAVVSYAKPVLKSWMGVAMDFGHARLIRIRA